MLASSMLILALMVSGQASAKWEVLTSKPGHYSVEMPADEMQESETPATAPVGANGKNSLPWRLKVHESMSRADSIDYLFIWMENPVTIPDPAVEDFLDYAQKNAVERPGRGTKLGAVKKIQLGKAQGRELTIESEDDKRVVRARIFVHGRGAYTLLAMPSSSKPLTAEVDRFFKSLTFDDEPDVAEAASKVAMPARPKNVTKSGGFTLGVPPKAATPGGGKWATVKLKDGDSTVEMPAQPSGHENESGPGFDIQTLIYHSKTMELLVMTVQGPTEVPDAEVGKALGRMRDMAASKFGSDPKVVSEKPARQGTLEGLEYELTLERSSVGTVKARGRGFTKEKTAYFLMAVSNVKDKPLTADAERFLDSLSLGGKSEAVAAKPKGRASKVQDDPFKGWGKPVDPGGDVEFEPSGRVLNIKVPGTLHVLAGDGDKFNAPRVLAPVRGDFMATVQVEGNFQPGRESTSGKISARQTGGLLLWRDKEHYIVLQRRSTVGKEGKLTRQVIFDEQDEKSRGDSKTQPVSEGSVILRLERHKGQVAGSFSTDGREWKSFKPIDADWLDGSLQVGVVVFNTSAEPHSVRFENYAVKPR